MEKRRFGLELMYRDGDRGLSSLAPGFARYTDWTARWKWYATEAQRDHALKVLSRKDTLFQYRPLNR